MGKVYDNLDNFTIESCKIRAVIKKCFEKVKYDIDFSIDKVGDGANTWEVVSPIDGFLFLQAKDSEGKEIRTNSEIRNGLKKVTLDLAEYVSINKKVKFNISYENKLISEVINNKFYSREYGIILTRSFGSHCQQFVLELKLENYWYSFNETIPRFSYPKKKRFEFTDIPSQKPISIALTSGLKIKRIGIFVMFILSALAGHYIPKFIDSIIRKVG